ncbi:hypothetical protein GDO86_005058 [Hymenochirus boettgeri]|uniref:Uncharacterized protein n=1 Tax=Hymenochirus boettgeri TaxID=247094 RepID=A0A8T2J501_9PIPI|nr:hypothetical protein GDO86_005058 [Hymenochirus boettgeri]
MTPTSSAPGNSLPPLCLSPPCGLSSPRDCDEITAGGMETNTVTRELDRSLQQMISAIVDERNRINIRQEISGLEIPWTPCERTDFLTIIVELLAVILTDGPAVHLLVGYQIKPRNHDGITLKPRHK